MNLREQREKLEHEILAPAAAFSDESRGREREITPCDLRTCYQRDIDRIVHSKSFRRLKHPPLGEGEKRGIQDAGRGAGAHGDPHDDRGY